MTFVIETATREKRPLKLILNGPSGAGKTTAALRIAHGIEPDASKIMLADTENRSSCLCVGRHGIGQFQLIPFKGPYSPDRLSELITFAEQQAATVLIIDSTSHIWNGSGGLLEMVDDVAAKKTRGNSFQAWGIIDPIYRKMLARIVQSPLHIICTLRAKQEWSMSKNNEGRSSVEKMGMASQARDGFEYEFDLALSVDMNHCAEVSKTGKDRFGMFESRTLPWQVTQETGKEILQFLNEMDEPAARPEPTVAAWSVGNPNDRQQLLAAFGMTAVPAGKGPALRDALAGCTTLEQAVEKAAALLEVV
jgi:energy-coupling factor transporter ATP-binding protein EcfA2